VAQPNTIGETLQNLRGPGRRGYQSGERERTDRANACCHGPTKWRDVRHARPHSSVRAQADGREPNGGRACRSPRASRTRNKSNSYDAAERPRTRGATLPSPSLASVWPYLSRSQGHGDRATQNERAEWNPVSDRADDARLERRQPRRARPLVGPAPRRPPSASRVVCLHTSPLDPTDWEPPGPESRISEAFARSGASEIRGESQTQDTSRTPRRRARDRSCRIGP
jgi:hypothetical protein